MTVLLDFNAGVCREGIFILITDSLHETGNNNCTRMKMSNFHNTLFPHQKFVNTLGLPPMERHMIILIPSW
jgi:hypothetical protein